jgi:hypothetical protein
MMLFIGCSFTMGMELENPEEERFSSLVANQLQTKHLNRSEAGLSNDGILRKTIKYCEKQPVDFAVIQFTKYSRREILNIKKPLPDTSPYLRINASNPSKGVKEYFANLSTPEDDIANFYKNKFLLEFYLTSKKIPFYFLQLSKKINRNLGRYDRWKYHKSAWDEDYFANYRSLWQKLSDQPVDCIYEILEGDEDSGSPYFTSSSRPHPNAEGHRKIADHILKNLKGDF